MLTIFTTAKPFNGHDRVIQCNALRSWKLLHPDVEVILFGDEQGALEVCAQYGLRHEPQIERFDGKIPYLNSMFARAQQLATHDYLCYSNCDIILLNDFLMAFQKAKSWRRRFLAVGRRWDTDITQAVDFTDKRWAGNLRRVALTQGTQMDDHWVDYFVFAKGMYANMPRLIVGYCFWDNWMIWEALSSKIPVIDNTDSVVAIHQNHLYSAESGRTKDNPRDARSLLNLDVIGTQEHLKRIDDSTHRLTKRGWIIRSWRPIQKKLAEARRVWTYELRLPVWHFFLDITRPARVIVGLRSKPAKSRSVADKT
jgi:hypothetical protein